MCESVHSYAMVRMRVYLRLVLVLAVALTTVCVHASVGDRSYKFALCVSSCEQDTCRNHRPVSVTDDTIVRPDPLPWYLVLFGWTCESNCEYHCTHRITNEARKRVRDITSRITQSAESEHANAKLLNEHWQLQMQAEQIEDRRLLDVCGEDKFLGPSGACLARLSSPPPPVMTDMELRHAIEARIELELARLSAIDKRTVQFYGKWPQLRILGVQEPMSVVFSIANLYVQVHAYQKIFGERVPSTFPLKRMYLMHATIASVAWIASSVFHARDLWWTERWDYFSAAAVLVSGLFISVCRIARFEPSMRMFRYVLVGCVGAWILHVLYLLSHRRLDYTYNMIACITLGVVHNILWLVYAHAPGFINDVRLALLRVSGDAPGHAAPLALPTQACRRLELLIVLMFIAPALELFDFPPLFRLLDAHALWHAVTVPLTLWWYQWLADDAHECVKAHAWCLDQHDADVTDVDELQTSSGGRTEKAGTSSHAALSLPVSMLATTSDTMHGSMHYSEHEISTGPALPLIAPVLAQIRTALTAFSVWGLNVMRALQHMFISS